MDTKLEKVPDSHRTLQRVLPRFREAPAWFNRELAWLEDYCSTLIWDMVQDGLHKATDTIRGRTLFEWALCYRRTRHMFLKTMSDVPETTDLCQMALCLTGSKEPQHPGAWKAVAEHAATVVECTRTYERQNSVAYAVHWLTNPRPFFEEVSAEDLLLKALTWGAKAAFWVADGLSLDIIHGVADPIEKDAMYRQPPSLTNPTQEGLPHVL